MKKSFTVLFPSMLDFHYPLLKHAFEAGGYTCEILFSSTDMLATLTELGREYSHNDMCFPANLIIGQFIHALKSGRYDISRVALLLPQTGGGCRACNYIHLLRKALRKAGMGFVPVISLNVSGVERHRGFSITPKMVFTACAAVFYGDLLMKLYNEVSPYEARSGESLRLVEKWYARIGGLFREGRGISPSEMPIVFGHICESFANVKRAESRAVKVCLAGELYIKYCAMGNFDTEKYLRQAGCEVYMGGFMNYMCYLIDCERNIASIYGRLSATGVGASVLLRYLDSLPTKMNIALEEHSFEAAPTYRELRAYGESFGILGETMGDGWLIFAELCIAMKKGCDGALLLLPFGCLVSHSCARGVIRRVRKLYPKAVIYPLDFDWSISDVNVKNRIQMALSFLENRKG